MINDITNDTLDTLLLAVVPIISNGAIVAVVA